MQIPIRHGKKKKQTSFLFSSKFIFEKHIPLLSLVLHHCLNQKVSPTGLKIQNISDGSILPPDKSGNDLNLKEPIKLMLIDENQRVGNIILKARHTSGATSKFKMLKTDPLAVLFDAFCKQHKLDPFQTTFLFDGATLPPSSTPNDHNLEDGDLIDVK